METTKFDSFNLIHDGDYVGGMYAASPQGTTIVVTSSVLEAVLLTADSADEWLEISGPNHEKYQRDEVTNGLDYDGIKPGKWESATIRVKRTDIERVLIFKRTDQLVSFAEQFDGQGLPFTDVITVLDEILARIAVLKATA